MKFLLWKGIIDECASRGVKEITFTGGEATIREDLWELMDYACKCLHDGDVALFTNGSLMTEAHIKWCKKRRIRLSTSLQGLRTYGRQTGTRRSYKRVLAFMARAAELGWPVDVSISVSKIKMKSRISIRRRFCLMQNASKSIPRWLRGK
ncbi:MAG: radical SAM protein [Victivallales bacterium]|nr:radical SAM protein [Victivallales bacterium]